MELIELEAYYILTILFSILFIVLFFLIPKPYMAKDYDKPVIRSYFRYANQLLPEIVRIELGTAMQRIEASAEYEEFQYFFQRK